MWRSRMSSNFRATNFGRKTGSQCNRPRVTSETPNKLGKLQFIYRRHFPRCSPGYMSGRRPGVGERWRRTLRLFPLPSWNAAAVSGLALGIGDGGPPCQLERPSPDVPGHSGRTAWDRRSCLGLGLPAGGSRGRYDDRFGRAGCSRA
jgi:hypothetical protein